MHMENSPYKLIEIDDKSWRIEIDKVRFFLFTGTKSALVADTGFLPENVYKYVKTLTDLPVTLVNTHTDPDHIGGNYSFEEAYMHPSEFAHYAKKSEHGGNARPVWEGDVIDIGGRSFEIVLIPGHTPGSIALLDRANRIILTGDYVSKSPVFIFGEGRNLNAFLQSLKKLEAMSGAFDTIYPCHGLFPIGKEAITEQRLAAENLLAGKLTPQEPILDVPAKMYVYGSASFYM